MGACYGCECVTVIRKEASPFVETFVSRGGGAPPNHPKCVYLLFFGQMDVRIAALAARFGLFRRLGSATAALGLLGLLLLGQVDVRIVVFRFAGLLRLFRILGCLRILRVRSSFVVLVRRCRGLDHLVEITVKHVPSSDGAHGKHEIETGTQGAFQPSTNG